MILNTGSEIIVKHSIERVNTNPTCIEGCNMYLSLDGSSDDYYRGLGSYFSGTFVEGIKSECWKGIGSEGFLFVNNPNYNYIQSGGKQDFSVSFWVNVGEKVIDRSIWDLIITSNKTNSCFIFQESYGQDNDNFWITMGTNPRTKNLNWYGPNDAGYIGSGWYHIIGQYDAVGSNSYMWVNGSQVASILGQKHTYSLNGNYFSIGFGPPNNNSNTFSKIDEVAIFNRCLTSGNIADLYNFGHYKHIDIKTGSNIKLNNKEKEIELNTGSNLNIKSSHSREKYEVPRDIGSCIYWFTFDDTNGKVVDEINKVEAITYPGSEVVQNQSGIRDKCFYFDKTKPSKIRLNDMNLTGDFSISAWIKMNGSQTNIRPIIFYPYDTEGEYDWAYAINMRHFGSLIDVWTNNPNEVGEWGYVNQPQIDDWYHIVGTIKGNKYGLFVNGSDCGQLDISESIPKNLMTIGYYLRNEGLAFSMDGNIDDVSIYNKVLNKSEVNKLYNFNYNKRIKLTETDNINLKSTTKEV